MEMEREGIKLLRKEIPPQLLDDGGVEKVERKYLDRLYQERVRQAGVKPEEKTR